MKRKVETKKVVCAKLDDNKDGEYKWINKEYKVSRKKATLMITMTKTRAFKRLYPVLEKKGRDKKLYRHVKDREQRPRDLDQIKCIKRMTKYWWRMPH